MHWLPRLRAFWVGKSVTAHSSEAPTIVSLVLLHEAVAQHLARGQDVQEGAIAAARDLAAHTAADASLPFRSTPRLALTTGSGSSRRNIFRRPVAILGSAASLQPHSGELLRLRLHVYSLLEIDGNSFVVLLAHGK